MNDKIIIKGARVHNLKNVDLDVPKNKLVVFTGVSGSGKSSLAYDTIYAEGQRRYVESLSTYARQFLGVMEKPDVDLIEGLSPAISIDQKAASRNPRSTVGTVTEVYDYLRLLFARIGHPHCPVCQREISTQSIDQIVDAIMKMILDTTKKEKIIKLMIFAPVVRDKKGEFGSLFSNLKAKGFKKVRVDKTIKDLGEDFVLIKTNKHTIEAMVDKISISHKDLKEEIFQSSFKGRLTDSVEQALKLTDGLVIVSKILDKTFDIPEYPTSFEDHLYSQSFACPYDNIQIPEVEPRTFSFNSPHGACSKCFGIGRLQKIAPDRLFAHDISIMEGAILPFSNIFENQTWYSRLMLTVCEKNGINPRIPFKNLSPENVDVLLHGTGDREYKVEGKNRFGKNTYIYETFTGIITELTNRYKATESTWVKQEIEKYMREKTCEECNGKRLSKEALSVTIWGLSIAEVTNMSITQCVEWIHGLSQKETLLNTRELEIGDLILKEISNRLSFLISVGLEYLTLDRSAATLSSGEAQRIRLASQIGSGLTGVLYVLDEPTIGLHMRDNQKLIDTLKKLRDLGNTVIVVEHDDEMMKQSDYIVDFGPGAGKLGGRVIAQGTCEEIVKDKNSITGDYLSGKKKITHTKKLFLELGSKSLKLTGASQFNLKNIDVEFPLAKLVVLTGVSGSGKSTLLVETLYPALQNELSHYYKEDLPKYTGIEGVENVDKVVLINQSPIGRTPRSNPATYTKVFDNIRDVFANTRSAKTFGYKKGRFSFNIKSGRCEACEGQGQNRIEMQFMSDIWVTCDVCKGTRYNSQTLEVEYRGKNIAQILSMTIDESAEFFHAHPAILSKLETLQAVGLGYMELGQSATTLSGGEAQRVKLSAELAKRQTGKTIYILDEPTTGLHFADIEKLLNVLRLLVEKGNTVVVIEHNIDVIKNADWIIDLGPEGGDRGGQIVYSGPYENLKSAKNSYTAQYIK
ncbi:excinuclease ABC subunit UvrA [Candidatus Woesebacteria bacterium]|nr:MAG: excinuclease ABC subunit UvrA [Candidatus Woesebacteria bacterium]